MLFQMVQLAEDSAVYLKAMVVQAEYNDEKDAYRELLSNKTQYNGWWIVCIVV